MSTARGIGPALATLAVVLCTSASAAPSATTKTEINHLFAHLKSSGCQFNRNGKWYSAEAASEHLQSKYDYMLKRNMIDSTESFIERAAAGSSTSGKPYLVQCAGSTPVPSEAWFSAELSRLRAKPGGR